MHDHHCFGRVCQFDLYIDIWHCGQCFMVLLLFFKCLEEYLLNLFTTSPGSDLHVLFIKRIFHQNIRLSARATDSLPIL